MSGRPQVRADVSVRCYACGDVLEGKVVNGTSDYYVVSFSCPGCGRRYEATVEVEEVEGA